MRLRARAYLEADNMASAIKDYTKAIELSPSRDLLCRPRALPMPRRRPATRRSTTSPAPSSSIRARAKAYAYRAWTYLQQQQAELGLKEVERALKLDANSADAYWVRGEIQEAQGRAELAVADLRQGLGARSATSMPRPGARAAWHRRAAAAARGRRGGPRRLAGLQKGKQFVARNEEFPRLQIELEMLGKGQPRILEWEVKQPPFQGIAILRFHAGTLENPRGPEEVEYAAIVDLQASTVVAIEMQRLGSQGRHLDLGRRQVIVASADGITDEFQLRQAKTARGRGPQAPRRSLGLGLGAAHAQTPRPCSTCSFGNSSGRPRARRCDLRFKRAACRAAAGTALRPKRLRRAHDGTSHPVERWLQAGGKMLDD